MSNTINLSMIDDTKKIDILRKNWMSHDARTQMVIVREFGWEKGNQLNKQIISEMGKTMMLRLMNAFGISQISNINEFKAICLAACEFYYPPPSMEYKFEILSDTKVLAIIKKCQSYDNVMKLGVSRFYECGCLAMRSGWYNALNMDVDEELVECLIKGDPTCKIMIRIKKWVK